MGLTLKEAKKKYREKNKECRYCEFSCIEKTLVDSWTDLSDFDIENIVYCKLSESSAGNVCEFYQVKEFLEE